jgi:hypothetical protein
MRRITVEDRYKHEFETVLAQLGIADPAVFLDVDWYEDMPVYTRFHQLDYLSSLSFDEANRILIRCTALYLERVVASAAQHGGVPGKTILRMAAITGWLDQNDDRQLNYDGTTDFLTPYIFLANLDHPGLRDFTLYPVTSPAGHFTEDAVSGDDRFAVAEGQPDKFGGPSPEHTYIYMPGSEGTERLRIAAPRSRDGGTA